MRSYSLTELFGLTRAELFALQAKIMADLAGPPEGSPDRAILLATLHEIRRVIATPRFAP